MRITTNQMARNILFNLSDNARRTERLEREMSSGKRVTVPSDDPSSAIKILHLKTALMESDQYRRNLEDGQGWLQTSEAALNSVEQIVGDVQTLAIQGANGSLPTGARDALAKSVQELYNQLLAQANSMYGNRYLFGGWKTLTQPYTEVAGVVTYNGDANEIKREIGFGQTVPVNLPGDRVFGPPPGATDDVFTTLTKVRDAVNSGDIAALTGQLSSDLATIHDNLLAQGAEVGARVSRLDQTSERLLDAKTNFSDLLDKEQNADIVEVVMNLKILENARNTTLAATAQLIKTTLLDFLR
ncbi:MAG: flagellar hook-associated protein FlgL [Bacillota bacterium]